MYGGHPESLVVLGVSLLVFMVVWAGRGAPRVDRAPTVRPLALVARGRGVRSWDWAPPCCCPGSQVGLLSVRRNGTGVPAFPLTHLPNLVAAGLQGAGFTHRGLCGTHRPGPGRRRRMGGKGGGPRCGRWPCLVVVSGALTFLSPVDQLLRPHPRGAHRHLEPGRHDPGARRGGAGHVRDRRPRPLRPATRARPPGRWRGGWAAPSPSVEVGSCCCWRDRLWASRIWTNTNTASCGRPPRPWWAWPRAPCCRGAPGAGRRTERGGASGTASAVVLFAVGPAFLLSTGASFWSVSPSYFPTNPAVDRAPRQRGHVAGRVRVVPRWRT